MTTSSSAALRPEATGFAGFDYGLYAAVILLWGTSWIALHFQLGVVAPEVSILWRFVIAASIMFAWVALAGGRLRFDWRTHRLFAALGALLFSFNFICFYYGGTTTPSGLLAVVFSLASIGNMVLGFAVFRTRPTPRMIAGAVLGFLGVGSMFAPQIIGAEFDHAALGGLALCILGTLIFCSGNMVSTATQRRGIPVLSANAWGMAYGCLYLFLFALARGSTFTIEPTMRYLGSLLSLSIFASVFAFWAYLTLLGRIGAGRAGYSTVMYPVVALVISSLVEGYAWTPPAVVGLAMVLAGNLLVLTGRGGARRAKDGHSPTSHGMSR